MSVKRIRRALPALACAGLAASVAMWAACSNDGKSRGDGDATGDGIGDDGDGSGDGSGGDGGSGSGGDGNDDGDDGSDDDGGGPKFDTGPTEGGCEEAFDAVLTGVVHAPNREVPVSGALVYVADSEPSGIPQTVYCAECEEIDECDPNTLTNPDGSFSLQARSGDGKWLVVTKGQFMRITPIDVAEGNTALDVDVTDLPGVNDPANGLYIPRIAIGISSPDSFELILAKVGLAEIAPGGGALVPNTENFDAYDNDIDPTMVGLQSHGDFSALINDPDALEQYHIIFVPCIGGVSLVNLEVPLPAADYLRDWVALGGRIYATDYAVRWIESLFPDYQTVNGEPGPITFLPEFDSLATVLHPDLLAWLQAMPDPLKDVNPLNGGGTTYPTLFDLPQVTLIENYSGIEYPLPEILADDGQGGQIDVGHVAWLEGPWPGLGGLYPPAVIAQYGCGKIHFTSYHSVGIAHNGLIPQELVMLYSILEVGVCQDATVPP